jgi:integrase/recombinase XerC
LVIPLNTVLRQELERLHTERGAAVQPGKPVIYSERGGGLTVNTVTVWFHTLYHTLGLTGCSSHSGRRTFITRAAKKVVEAGGSLRDVQQLAGHASLSMTQRYIEGDSDAKRKLVNLV